MKLWGGRFTEAEDALTEAFNESLSFDKRMYRQDIKGSIAHAKMLGKQGIISEVTKFITDNKGNIVYLDQYVDKVDGMFFMRIEWELEGFLIPRDKLYDYITTLYAQR